MIARRPLAEQCALLYAPRGSEAHLHPPDGSETAYAAVLCGRPWPEPDGWLGTGSQAEYDRAAQMPLCGHCEGRALAGDARHAEQAQTTGAGH